MRKRPNNGQTPANQAALPHTELPGAAIHESHDINERVQADNALLRSEHVTGYSIAAARDGIFLLDRECLVIEANEVGARRLGATVEKMIGRDIFEFLPPDATGRRKAMLREVAETGQPMVETIERNGTWFETVANPHLEASGALKWMSIVTRDITDRKRVEAALRDSQNEMAEAQRMAHVGSWRWDVETDVVTWSDEHWSILGLDPGEVKSVDVEYFDSFVHPDDLELLHGARQHALKTSAPFYTDFRIVRRDGEVRYVHSQAETGDPSHGRYFRGTLQDITERKQIEEQLRQAQKMDAVGQLTGGVAHDFNNLLTVILGNLNLIREGTSVSSDAKKRAAVALRACERGAELTGRLLAFSRKQHLAPAATDVNDLLTETSALMKSTLGEDIDLRFVAARDLRNAMVDRQQLENVILNLALNARDAMPKGGRLTIETSGVILDNDEAPGMDEVRPGSYVLIAVSDTGTGMPSEVVGQAFEPFFTTKDVGRGSGLGLSMVYGFAKQSDGHVAIHSEIGKGTTIKLYLPEAAAKETPPVDRDRPDAPVVGGDEAILVLEDDEDVRAYVTTVLRYLGYAVFEAARGTEALTTAADAAFDLLLTDVVLPDGLSGPDTARRIRENHPHLKVLYTSGYAENEIVHLGRLDHGVDLLLKPYSKDVLARRVRAALDAVASV